MSWKAASETALSDLKDDQEAKNRSQQIKYAALKAAMEAEMVAQLTKQ
jgi:hypothetical protein